MRRVRLLAGFALAVLHGAALPAAAASGTALPAGGGDTLALTLREAVLGALARHPTVTIQRRQTEIARAASRAAGSAFEPELAVTVSGSEAKSQRFLGANPTPFELTSEQRRYGATLGARLPVGADVSVNAAVSGSLSSIYTDQYSGEIGVSVTQSLLRGFGPGPNLAELRRARRDVELSQIELEEVGARLVAEVETAYWELYLAGQEQRIQQESLALAQRQLEESRERVAVGRLPDLELAAVRAELATRDKVLIDARSRHERTRLDLLSLLNPDSAGVWQCALVPVDTPSVPVAGLDSLAVHEELALRCRTDLRQARLQLAKAELEVVRTRNGLLPRLDLFIALGRTTYARSFADGLPDLGSPFYSASVGASFEVGAANLRPRAEHARALATEDQAALALRNMELLTRRDVRAAYVEAWRSAQQIEASRVARELQQQKLAAEQEKFRVGRSTNFLVLQAQRDLTGSQLDEARARVAHLLALLELQRLDGTLLARRGIGVAAPPPD